MCKPHWAFVILICEKPNVFFLQHPMESGCCWTDIFLFFSFFIILLFFGLSLVQTCFPLCGKIYFMLKYFILSLQIHFMADFNIYYFMPWKTAFWPVLIQNYYHEYTTFYSYIKYGSMSRIGFFIVITLNLTFHWLWPHRQLLLGHSLSLPVIVHCFSSEEQDKPDSCIC